MKKLLFAFGVLLTISQFSFAQGSDKELPQAKAKRQLSNLNSAVQLSTEQFNKANTIYIDYYTQKDALKANTKLAKQDREDKEDALKAKRDKALKQALTADQWKKWETYLKLQKEKEKSAVKEAKQKVKNEK